MIVGKLNVKINKPKKPAPREYTKMVLMCLNGGGDYKIPSNLKYDLYSQVYNIVAVLLSYGFFQFLEEEKMEV